MIPNCILLLNLYNKRIQKASNENLLLKFKSTPPDYSNKFQISENGCFHLFLPLLLSDHSSFKSHLSGEAEPIKFFYKPGSQFRKVLIQKHLAVPIKIICCIFLGFSFHLFPISQCTIQDAHVERKRLILSDEIGNSEEERCLLKCCP